MTQYGYEPLSPDDSGSTLLERLNGVVPALLTNHKGAQRPAYVQPGMLWIDDSGALWLLNLYDGTGDVTIATINPDTHAPVAPFVPLGRKLKVGPGLSLDGTAGSDEETAEGDLSADRLIKLLFATEAEIAAGEITDKPVHPAGMAAAIAALASGGIQHVRLVTASGAVTPSAGVKKWLGLLVGGGAGGQAAYQGYPGAGGSGAGLTMFLTDVSDATTYPLVIGAGGTAGAGAHGRTGGAGGASSLVIAGTTYSATGGEVAAGAPGVGSGGIVNMTGQRGVAAGLSASGAGGGAPLGIGLGGPSVQQPAAPQMNTGLPGSGFGAGGSGGYRNSGASYQDIMFAGAGTAGALILLEF